MAYLTFHPRGRLALVAGGKTGIGLGMVQGLAEAGADVAIGGTNAAAADRWWGPPRSQRSSGRRATPIMPSPGARWWR